MAFWHLSRISRQSAQSNHVDAVRAALRGTGVHPADQAFLGYALFKELDDLADHAGAWAALEGAAAAAQTQYRYDAQATTAQFAAIKRAFPEPRPAAIAEDQRPRPIFIVGLHRSGTSLIERMLGASPEVFDLGETHRLSVALRHAADLDFAGVVELELLDRVAQIDPVALRSMFNALAQQQCGSHRFVTEKLPENFLHVGFIQQALPEAKVVHMRREPVDLCFANLRELFGAGAVHSYAIADLIHYHRLYADLMAHWQRVCPGFVLDVDYEALVRDPQRESKRVFDFCGLDWQPDVIDLTRRADAPVSTLSSVQVRQPVSRASIGRWRPYRPWLTPLLDAFGEPAID